MIAIDASALVDWLLGTPRRGAAVGDRMRNAGLVHTLDFAQLEVLSALRRGVARRELTSERATLALRRLGTTPLLQHRAAPLVARAWALRTSHTPYDAAYVALAESLDAPLVTTDRHLARSSGHRATILEAGAG
jgi:predicted nucleic acid-binding protein